MRKSNLSFARYSLSRRQQRQKQVHFALSAGFLILLAGTVVVTKPGARLIEQWSWQLPFQMHQEVVPVDTSLRQLITQSSSNRRENLIALAQGRQSLERSRARYLLASDLITENEGSEALRWLEGLERQYPVLAGHIVLRRAQAYELLGDEDKAFENWRTLLERHSNEPVAAEALYALLSEDSPYTEMAISQLPDSPSFFDRVQQAYGFSADNPQYWETALENYPSHPRFLDLVRQRLARNPYQPSLMLLLANYAMDDPETIPVLDRLVDFYRPAVGQEEFATVQPEDWEVIAMGYWRDRKYGQASNAYSKAPRTPRNAYLAALALQYSQQNSRAIQAYKRILNEFPNEPETASSLLQLASLLPDIEAVPYLDRVVDQFPDQAGDALIAKAETLERLDSLPGAERVREQLIAQYSHTDAAAEYRWEIAKKQAQSGNIEAALAWIEPVRQNNLESDIARQAIFWEGKWAQRLGREQQAKQAYQTVLSNYPWSYYAWRSAVHLGKDVGDFDTVRHFEPRLDLPPQRVELTAGSPALQELYQIGQSEDAWTQWQAEFQNRLEPTLSEQFTNALMHMETGDYLQGIALLWAMDSDDPEKQAEYQEFRQQKAYWKSLYPFPYADLVTKYSKENQLNPLLVISLMRQESQFQPDIRSEADAVGLMQIIPDTAKWAAQNNNLKEYSLEDPEDNVLLGTWFFDQTHRSYNNNSLLAVASYNAGQGNVSRWLPMKATMDEDEFVEAIPFNETENYVKQVFGNYWNYLQLYDPRVAALVTQE